MDAQKRANVARVVSSFWGGWYFSFFFRVREHAPPKTNFRCVFTNKEGVFVLSHRTPVTSFRALATPARTHARTHTHRRRPSDDERRGAWSAGVAGWMMCLLQDRGIRSARSPLRRPPLFASLSPRPCKAAAPKGGPAFCFDLACPLSSSFFFFFFLLLLLHTNVSHYDRRSPPQPPTVFAWI